MVSRQPLSDHDHDQRGEHEAVEHERQVAVPAHVAEQQVDRDEADGGRRRSCRRRTARSSRRAAGRARRASGPCRGPRRARSGSGAGTRSAPRRRGRGRAKRPVVIVIPERETPGISARICEMPIGDGGRQSRKRPRAATCCGRAVGDPEEDTRRTARKNAICHGWPRCLSIASSPSAPTIAAGTVAIAIAQASRSSLGPDRPRCARRRRTRAT